MNKLRHADKKISTVLTNKDNAYIDNFDLYVCDAPWPVGDEDPRFRESVHHPSPAPDPVSTPRNDMRQLTPSRPIYWSQVSAP